MHRKRYAESVIVAMINEIMDAVTTHYGQFSTTDSTKKVD